MDRTRMGICWAGRLSCSRGIRRLAAEEWHIRAENRHGLGLTTVG